MNKQIIEQLKGYQPFEEIMEALRPGASILCHELSGAQKTHLAASVASEYQRPLIMLCENEKKASSAMEDLGALLGKCSMFPARELTFYQDVAASRDVAYRRIETMQKLLSGETNVVVATMDSLMHRIMPREFFQQATLKISIGERLSLDDLRRRLLFSGYSRENMVEGKGQFSIRGGILDIYPSDALNAYRIEFFDDEVDSIRTFDTISQRSLENAREVIIPPACEVITDSSVRDKHLQVLNDIQNQVSGFQLQKESEVSLLEDLPSEEDSEMMEDVQPEIKAKLQNQNRAEIRYRENIDRCIQDIQNGIGNRFLERFMNLLYDGASTILDYMDNPLVVLMNPQADMERMESRRNEFMHALDSALLRGEAVPGQENLLLSPEEVRTAIRRYPLLCLADFSCTVDGIRFDRTIDMGGKPIGSYGGRISDMCKDISMWQKTGWRVILLSGGSARGERMNQSFSDEGVQTLYDPLLELTPKPGDCIIYPLALSSGFLYPDARLAVLVESDVYGAKYQKAKKKTAEGRKMDSFTDVEIGDYVVHDTYGIGIYQGTKQLRSDGATRDFLMVEYLGNDKLYIPVDHFDRIQKYIGGNEGVPPKMTSLGGKDWAKQKKKVRDGLKAIAFDLVALYAQRKKNIGYAFGPDTPWQEEFEENFPYEETPDQLVAIDEIKKDMEKPMVMDRLLCGDVGYGKTEVALRAAFKAVMDGKQVAILAPTTVLVSQHYQTMIHRFEGFPVQIAQLSRFRSRKEQQQTIAQIADGSVDVVVGTHRLLGKDIHFKNLGLLIVDEEQRFGVSHKETIKNMKSSIDVLTLSATPIPRTLHMSMVGIRDMSVLETPPQARYPVQTYVMEYQDSVIRDAILREMGRNGQVFFLYNHVQSIERCYEQLQQLVPEARIAMAHGQMKENALEDIMLDFSEHRYDVLLCSTIIESGLDIPLVNTLIVFDADRFGLGQLYQIRGRVGRSNRLAYAYLTIRAGKILTESAQKRLNTIREFTEFGSGFRIAMRDLEIRGAGNILGAQQSGHLANIGYDLYCKLLDEAVKEASGQKLPAHRDLETRMDVHVNAYLPATYVEGEKQRLDVYKRIAGITSAAARDDVEEELVDRFGEEPACVANLVAVSYLKSMCTRMGIEKVTQKDCLMMLSFSSDSELDGGVLLAGVRGLDPHLTLNLSGIPKLEIRDTRLQRDEMLHFTVRVMERLTERIFPHLDENDKKDA